VYVRQIFVLLIVKFHKFVDPRMKNIFNVSYT